MKITIFEGTPEEYKLVAPLLSNAANVDLENLLNKEKGGSSSISPKDAIKVMLQRIPPSNGQMAVYEALADGELELGEFYKRTQRPAKVMRGVLGVLGRRINSTKEIHEAGLPGDTSAVLKYEARNSKGYYRLTDDALVALRELGLI